MMKQFLSLLLSWVLILTSMSPALAQVNPGRIAGKVVQMQAEGGAAVVNTSKRAGEAMARISQQLAKGTSQAAQVARVAVPEAIRVTGNRDIDVFLNASWLSRFYLAHLNVRPSILTPQESARIVLDINQTAYKSLSPQQKEHLYLSGFPMLAAEGPVVLSPTQLAEAKAFYRTVVAGTATLETFSIESWAKTMGCITNLGLFGEASDAEIILKAAQKRLLGTLTDVADTIAVRAMLNLHAYKEIQALADFRLSLTDNAGRPMQLSAAWREIQQYMQEASLELSIPQERIASTNIQIPTSASEWLNYYNPYNLIHTNPSAPITRDWLELRKGIEEKEIASQITQGVTPSSAVPALPARPSKPLQIPELEIPANTLLPGSGDLSLSSTQIPSSGVTPGVNPDITRRMSSKTSIIPQPEAGGVEPVGEFPMPSIWQRLSARWQSFTSHFRRRSANTNAQIVLSKPYPMLTQLRDIVFSDAAITHKKEALVRLYKRGVFNTFLKDQPSAVRDTIELASSDAARGQALLHLYLAKYLDPSLQAVSDVLEQGSLLDELNKIVTDPTWSDKADLAYSYAKQLPFNGEDTFEGTVPTVPEADQGAIAATFRPQGFAASNSAPGVVRPKGIYYENNIPFYFRSSNGRLSSQPVGILSQTPANWYGRFLSSIGMASKPGFTVPQGFVLALDEQGKWKFVMPRGNLSIVEGNKYSTKILKSQQKDGSVHVSLDLPYSSTDLLAMAHMLEHNPKTLNLELKLNTPHSLDRFLTFHALFVGNDAGNTLTGPFKESLRTMQGLANTMANAVSGVGYATPIAGGVMMPMMSRWGNATTTKVIYGTAGAALAYSVFRLGMYGTIDPTSLSLGALAIPTVALVLGASLANSFIPTFLNFYKDPAARTAANLDFSTKKQASRMGLSLLTTAAIALGGNWTIVAPIGLGLLTTSYLLFRNTPMFKEAQETARKARAEKSQANKFSLKDWYAQLQKKRNDQKVQREKEAPFVKDYKDFARNMPEMQAIKNRVKMVYASYAASLMMMGQAANAAFPAIGQTFITVCMGATLATRLLATRLVKRNIMTDDQLTGISLPTLALTGAALALAPYSGPLALATGVAGILHYMATAVPGQLDAARMQNIVTAEMSRRKQEVLENTSLSEADKEAAIQRLTDEEKVWSAQASKGYSYYNARGLWGVGAATAGAYLFADLGPQWAADTLTWISHVFGDAKPSLALNRLIFGYSTVISSILAFKNRGLFKDFVNFFRRQKVTEEALSANKIHASNFGITEKNAELRLVDSNKEIKTLKTLVVDYGYYSEQRMTFLFNRMVVLHNRLVAEAELLGMDRVKPAFEELVEISKTYEKILGHSDLSVMLNREFGKLQANLYNPTTGQLLATPSYVEEGAFGLPPEYDAYESASALLRELDQMAYTLGKGGVVDYGTFVDYVNRIQEDLLRYEKANPADSPRVAALRKKMNTICEGLAKADKRRNLLAPTKVDPAETRVQKQTLRDLLMGYRK